MKIPSTKIEHKFCSREDGSCKSISVKVNLKLLKKHHGPVQRQTDIEKLIRLTEIG